MELINETMFQHAHVKATLKEGRRLPPGRKRAAYTKMFMGLFYLAAFVLLGGKYNFSVALKPEFALMPLWKRFVVIFCLHFIVVLMYHSIQYRPLPTRRPH